MTTTDPSPRDQNPRRYRCNACGNLTRFDVTSTVRTRAYHHYAVSGDLSIEDAEVLAEEIEDVSCRWCGNGSAVVELEAGDETIDTSDQRPPEPRAD